MNQSSIIFIIIIVGLVLWRRTKAMIYPIKGNGIRIIVPLFFILPGFFGFLSPTLHVTVEDVIIAILLGIVLSIPVIVTTNYEIREDGRIYAKKSKAFIFAFIGIVIIRLLLRTYIQGYDVINLSMLYFIVAATYLILWRINSYIKFRSVLRMKQEDAIMQ